MLIRFLLASSDVGAVSIAQDGEFIQFLNPLSIKLGTIFDYGRFGSPSLQLYDPTRVVHSIESIRTGVSSYLGLGKGSTLAEIDSARSSNRFTTLHH